MVSSVIGKLGVIWANIGAMQKSNLSQKEKNKYRMLTHIYEILKKNGSEETRGRTGIKMQM